jgi:hypothetical protein
MHQIKQTEPPDPSLPLCLHCFQPFQRHQQSIPSITSKGSWLKTSTDPERKPKYIKDLNKKKNKKLNKNEAKAPLLLSPTLFSTLWHWSKITISFYTYPKA